MIQVANGLCKQVCSNALFCSHCNSSFSCSDMHACHPVDDMLIAYNVCASSNAIRSLNHTVKSFHSANQLLANQVKTFDVSNGSDSLVLYLFIYLHFI